MDLEVTLQALRLLNQSSKQSISSSRDEGAGERLSRQQGQAHAGRVELQSRQPGTSDKPPRDPSCDSPSESLAKGLFRPASPGTGAGMEAVLAVEGLGREEGSARTKRSRPIRQALDRLLQSIAVMVYNQGPTIVTTYHQPAHQQAILPTVAKKIKKRHSTNSSSPSRQRNSQAPHWRNLPTFNVWTLSRQSALFCLPNHTPYCTSRRENSATQCTTQYSGSRHRY